MLAGIVYACDGVPLAGLPLDSWVPSAVWLALVGGLAFLMVSTWRYPSFKDLTLTRPRSPLTFVLVASVIYLISFFSKPVLLAAAAIYVLSGIVIRLGGHGAPPLQAHAARTGASGWLRRKENERRRRAGPGRDRRRRFAAGARASRIAGRGQAFAAPPVDRREVSVPVDAPPEPPPFWPRSTKRLR